MRRALMTACVLIFAIPAVAAPPPKDPGIWARLVGRGAPAAVRQALKDAKRAPDRDTVLLQAFRRQLGEGKVSVYSAIKLATATEGMKANDTILSEFAKTYRSDLTVKQVKRLASATYTVGGNNNLIRDFKKANAERLSPSQLRKLDRALASPSSGSSKPSSTGINVGGVNVGGLNMGGKNMGGMELGTGINYGGVSTGGTSFGGTSVGGINL
jgi:hypothetical protein